VLNETSCCNDSRASPDSRILVLVSESNEARLTFATAWPALMAENHEKQQSRVSYLILTM
jgi:hypothetical protein